MCDSHFFEEDGDTLDRLVAQWSLGGCELEGVADLVGEISCLKSFANCLLFLVRGAISKAVEVSVDSTLEADSTYNFPQIESVVLSISKFGPVLLGPKAVI